MDVYVFLTILFGVCSVIGLIYLLLMDTKKGKRWLDI